MGVTYDAGAVKNPGLARIVFPELFLAAYCRPGYALGGFGFSPEGLDSLFAASCAAGGFDSRGGAACRSAGGFDSLFGGATLCSGGGFGALFGSARPADG